MNIRVLNKIKGVVQLLFASLLLYRSFKINKSRSAINNTEAGLKIAHSKYKISICLSIFFSAEEEH